MWSPYFLILSLTLSQSLASEGSFNVNDDIFAFPQYEIVYSESYIPYSKAARKLGEPRESPPSSFKSGDVSVHQGDNSPTDEELPDETYEWMTLHGQPYLCTIPVVRNTPTNQTREEPSESDQQEELVRAVHKGRELLHGMEGNQCLFYSTGWWTYSFCYNSYVRQFHALSPGAGSARIWPPQEDPHTPSYILGKFDPKSSKEASKNENMPETGLAELQKKAETSYLVQRLDGGTPCDLTGANRKIEVQFHCNPQLTDRIGWIKETSTCSYLMIIYTPRLCNDIAFLPPKETRAHPITCQGVLHDEEIAAWEVRKKEEVTRKMVDQGNGQRMIIGDIEIGAMKHVGKDGQKIDRGRIVLTQEEKAETIIMQKDGQISSVSNSDLKKLDLDPEDVESFRKELQKLAGGKDWKIERLDDVNGQIQLRGVVSTDDDEGSQSENKQAKTKDSGSEEEYKDEV